MMQRLLNLGLLLAFLVCYLEWGQDQSSFLFQMEYSIFFEKKESIDTFTHPFIIIPFIGQLLIFYTLFQKKPNRKLTVIGLSLLSILVLLILLVGLLSLNIKIILSTITFLLISLMIIFGRKYLAPAERRNQ